jgi:hypothetical protein
MNGVHLVHEAEWVKEVVSFEKINGFTQLSNRRTDPIVLSMAIMFNCDISEVS